MTHLYDAGTWTIDEPGPPREYVISAGDEVLANVTRVAIRRPDDAAMPYADPHAMYDETRTVVCAASPDGGTRFFYVDRAQDPSRGAVPATAVPPPSWWRRTGAASAPSPSTTSACGGS